MKSSLARKIGVAVILFFTSLALIVPSVAILWSIYDAAKNPKPITIDPSQITITTAAPSAAAIDPMVGE